jgi:DnaJ-class molecular chaperone
VTPPPDEPYDPQRCTACRGTGRVISNLGGERHEVACPWCDGSGRFIPGHDAQEGAPADVSSSA